MEENLRHGWMNYDVMNKGGCLCSGISLNSCTSNISTLRLVLFLIWIATSCGTNLPHTLTLLCFCSIKYTYLPGILRSAFLTFIRQPLQSILILITMQQNIFSVMVSHEGARGNPK
nr:hypothetical protein Iba_scaffold30864CG0010 [Ipomoea batatas]GME10587.1 hypothetical protein Iba_scaffold10277CG0010 [Ipomoea batatas]